MTNTFHCPLCKRDISLLIWGDSQGEQNAARDYHLMLHQRVGLRNLLPACKEWANGNLPDSLLRKTIGDFLRMQETIERMG